MLLILSGAVINTDNISVIKPSHSESFSTLIYPAAPTHREGWAQPQAIEIAMDYTTVMVSIGAALDREKTAQTGHELV